MINVIALIQLRAFARQYGFFLFLLWMASFVAYFTNPASSWGSLLAMSTPFVVGWFLVRFRNGALDGHISFRRGLVFSFYTFFYASLLSMMLATVKQLEPVYKANGMSLNELRQSINAIGQLSPIEIAFVFMMQNFLFGLIMSFPIALICQRGMKVRNKHTL